MVAAIPTVGAAIATLVATVFAVVAIVVVAALVAAVVAAVLLLQLRHCCSLHRIIILYDVGLPTLMSSGFSRELSLISELIFYHINFLT